MSKNYPVYLQLYDRVHWFFQDLKYKWQSRNDPKPYIGEERCIHETHHSKIVEIFDDKDMVRFENGEVQSWYHCTTSLAECGEVSHGDNVHQG